MTLVMRAIVRAADADRIATEIDDVIAGRLLAVHAERVAALVSRHERVPAATETELRTHDAITRTVHEVAPSLPSRFGDVFSDEGALVSALRAREDVLAMDLDRVGDRVELSVTLRWRASIPRRATAVEASGRAYLESRAGRERERREAEQVVARLVELLPCERAFIRHRICPRDGVAAIVAILSTRSEVPSLRRHIGSFAERSREIVTEVHGPLPPFSFVS